jgi:hypothetical protein
MARPKSKGAYAPLAAQYYLDDAVLEAGPEAELLYVRCLSFLASVSTDGFLTDRQMKVVGIGLRNVPRRVTTLLGVGLLEASPGGFVARSWLKWNKSAAQTDRHLRNDRERKASKHTGKGDNSGRNVYQFQTDSSPQYSSVQLSAVQLSKEHAPTAQVTVKTAVYSFDNFWTIWPRSEGKADALKAWTKAVRKTSDEVIYAAARAYANHPNRPAKQFVPHGATWLNGERWNDGEPTATENTRPSKADEVIDVLEQGRRMQAEHERRAINA